MKKLKVAILGQGRSGFDIHGKYLLTDQERFEVVAVAEPDEYKRKKAEAAFGCVGYTDYKDILRRNDIDLVVNATPSHLHAPVSVELLKNGFNVLCEKPFGSKASEVDEMIMAAKESGKMIAPFQQSRFGAYYQQVRKVIKSGDLGRIVQVSIRFDGFARRWDWQCCQEFKGGNLYNTGPHPVDQALNLLDYEGMPGVFCKMDRVNTFGDAEDYVKLILTAPERPLIDVQISSCNAYPSFTYHVQGSRGGLTGGMTEMKWRYFKEDEAKPQGLVKEPLVDDKGDPAYCSETLRWYEEKWELTDGEAGLFTYAVNKVYTNLYDYIFNGVPLIITPEQVRQQIAVMEECHRQNPLPKRV